MVNNMSDLTQTIISMEKESETKSKIDTAIPEDRCSIVSIVCRICFDDSKDEPIITPCLCRGTVAFVHKSCLEKWLSESNTTACELCHHVYETERVPKYTAKQSVWRWVKHEPTNLGFRIRHVRYDLVACAILTPLAIVITYVCLFSADYYNQQRFSNVPTARWTSISLLVMIAIILFGYYIWVYVVVGYHGRMWYYWWQRECIVRYIPPENSTRIDDGSCDDQMTESISEDKPNGEGGNETNIELSNIRQNENLTNGNVEENPLDVSISRYSSQFNIKGSSSQSYISTENELPKSSLKTSAENVEQSKQ